jgi:hypothetical protein
VTDQIPADAITAAADALHAARCVSESCRASGHEADRLLASVHMTGWQSADLDTSRIVLAAAAPVIAAQAAAAERERIAAAIEAEAASGRKLGLTRISLRVVAGRLRDGKPIPAPQNDDGERCNCRCKNPKGQCGCCDESLSGWYAEQDAP